MVRWKHRLQTTFWAVALLDVFHTCCDWPLQSLFFLLTAAKQGLKMETFSCPSGVCSRMSEMLLTGFITRWLQKLLGSSVVVTELEGLIFNSWVKMCNSTFWARALPPSEQIINCSCMWVSQDLDCPPSTGMYLSCLPIYSFLLCPDSIFVL